MVIHILSTEPYFHTLGVFTPTWEWTVGELDSVEMAGVEVLERRFYEKLEKLD